MKTALFNFAVWLPALLISWGSDQVTAQSRMTERLEIAFRAERTGIELERDLILNLKNKSDGTLVLGATIEIDVDMPSMPMMHKVSKVFAKPDDVAGQYRARVKLEMAGEWAARITVTKPYRFKVIRKFQIDEPRDYQMRHKSH